MLDQIQAAGPGQVRAQELRGLLIGIRLSALGSAEKSASGAKVQLLSPQDIVSRQHLLYALPSRGFSPWRMTGTLRRARELAYCSMVSAGVRAPLPLATES